MQDRAHAQAAQVADGSAQTLTAEPFERYKEQIEGDAITEYHKDGEIPVFTIDSCYDGAMDEIVAGAIMVARYPVGIVDLRANLGGSDSIANTWLRQYTYTDTERPMYRNQYLMNVFSGGSGAEDGWIENDRVLIVLTSKNIQTYNCTVDKSIKVSDHYPIWCHFSFRKK